MELAVVAALVQHLAVGIEEDAVGTGGNLLPGHRTELEPRRETQLRTLLLAAVVPRPHERLGHLPLRLESEHRIALFDRVLARLPHAALVGPFVHALLVASPRRTYWIGISAADVESRNERTDRVGERENEHGMVRIESLQEPVAIGQPSGVAPLHFVAGVPCEKRGMVPAALHHFGDVFRLLLFRLYGRRAECDGRTVWFRNIDILHACHDLEPLRMVKVEYFRSHCLFVRLQGIEHARCRIALEGIRLLQRVLAPVHPYREERFAVDEHSLVRVKHRLSRGRLPETAEPENGGFQYFPVLERELKSDILLAIRKILHRYCAFGTYAVDKGCRTAHNLAFLPLENKSPGKFFRRFDIGVGDIRSKKAHFTIKRLVAVCGRRDEHRIRSFVRLHPDVRIADLPYGGLLREEIEIEAHGIMRYGPGAYRELAAPGGILRDVFVPPPVYGPAGTAGPRFARAIAPGERRLRSSVCEICRIHPHLKLRAHSWSEPFKLDVLHRILLRIGILPGEVGKPRFLRGKGGKPRRYDCRHDQKMRCHLFISSFFLFGPGIRNTLRSPGLRFLLSAPWRTPRPH